MAGTRVISSRIKIIINWVGNTMLVSYNSRNCTATSHAADLTSNVYGPAVFLARGSGLAYLELAYFHFPDRWLLPHEITGEISVSQSRYEKYEKYGTTRETSPALTLSTFSFLICVLYERNLQNALARVPA